jgi:hypothetical protein
VSVFRIRRFNAKPFGFVMAGLDPAIPLIKARSCHAIGIAGSSPAMTRMDHFDPHASLRRPRRRLHPGKTAVAPSAPP